MRWWLPEDHLCWQVIRVTGELDLSALYGACRADGQGQEPYDPAMMLTLVVYCTARGKRSSRKMAGACADDVGCRVILGGGPAPSHQAFAVFRRRHRDAIRALFTQVLGIMAADGAVTGHCAAVDGSPVAGNASRSGNLTLEQLDARIAREQEKLDAAAAQWLAGPAAQPGLDEEPGGEDDGGPGFPPGMPRAAAGPARKLARLREARRALEGKAAGTAASARAEAARAEAARLQKVLEDAGAANDGLVARYEAAVAAGRRWPSGKKPVGKDKNARTARKRAAAVRAADRARAAGARAAALIADGIRVNAADPGTRVLPAKNGGWEQGWNLQLGALRNQVLVSVELHDSPADAEALIPVIRAAMANLAAAARLPGAGSLRDLVRAWLADSGYASAASFSELAGLLLLVAVTGDGVQAGRRKDGRKDGRRVPDAWKPMESRLATPAGKALYKRRAAQVEPAFAQYFARFGRRFFYRGRDAVDAEAKFLGTVHNILKLITFRRKASRAGRPAPRLA